SSPAIRLGFSRRSMMISRGGPAAAVVSGQGAGDRPDFGLAVPGGSQRRWPVTGPGDPDLFLPLTTDHRPLRAGGEPDHLLRMMRSAKTLTPSINAAAMIIEVLMFPAISGCRDMLSTAAAASLPIPNAAPMITMPAPIPLRSENGVSPGAACAGALAKRRIVP